MAGPDNGAPDQAMGGPTLLGTWVTVPVPLFPNCESRAAARTAALSLGFLACETGTVSQVVVTTQ